MSRSLLLILALAMVAPLASAQTPATSLELAFPPVPDEASEHDLAVPFDVTFEVGGLLCLTPSPSASSTSYVVGLTAAADSGDVEVQPAQLTFTVPSGQTVTGAYAQTLPASLLISPANATLVNATVTATFAGGQIDGCVGAADVPAAEATATYAPEFTDAALASADDPKEEMPGIGVVALLGVLALAFVARRK